MDFFVKDQSLTIILKGKGQLAQNNIWLGIGFNNASIMGGGDFI